MQNMLLKTGKLSCLDFQQVPQFTPSVTLKPISIKKKNVRGWGELEEHEVFSLSSQQVKIN